MSKRILKIKSEWDARASQLGRTRRAVLFKRFPTWLNDRIHRQHVSFVLRNIPETATRLLDVGCGYGRISREVKRRHPELSLHGIELSTEFARFYQQEIGDCFNGPVQEYPLNQACDIVVIVTLLMYLDTTEQRTVLEKLWSVLPANGVLLCIEPAVEFLNVWRRISGKPFASPTGGSVHHFTMTGLKNLLESLDGGVLRDEMSVYLVPGVKCSALHHGLAISKAANSA